jgi:hypothetical protein
VEEFVIDLIDAFGLMTCVKLAEVLIVKILEVSVSVIALMVASGVKE